MPLPDRREGRHLYFLTRKLPSEMQSCHDLLCQEDQVYNDQHQNVNCRVPHFNTQLGSYCTRCVGLAVALSVQHIKYLPVLCAVTYVLLICKRPVAVHCNCVSQDSSMLNGKWPLNAASSAKSGANRITTVSCSIAIP